MSEGALHRLIITFDQAFSELGSKVSASKLEELAVFIHKAMTVQARHYHTLEHVFTFIEPGNPIQTLAGLFHDIVYYQVDLGFLPAIHRIIAPFISQRGQEFTIALDAPDDPQFNLVLEAFGYQRGDSVSVTTGLNEFLSAVVMNDRLGDLVAQKDLLLMDLCIEATIPFRGPANNGQSCFQALEERLRSINRRLSFGMRDQEVRDAIRLALRVANKDVSGFAEQDAAVFLSNTWRLLPEMNVPLRAGNVYTIREYREALQNMDAFFSQLDPQRVFHQYSGEPAQREFELMVERARRNIEIAQRYLRVKLLAQALLEALAMESGGDAPLSLFMGDTTAEADAHRLEKHLPAMDNPSWAEPNSELYHLLATGRTDNPGFDLNTSPLSLFIYKSLSPGEFNRAFDAAQEMFACRISPAAFLQQLNPQIVSAVARASAAMATTRSQALQKYSRLSGSAK